MQQWQGNHGWCLPIVEKVHWPKKCGIYYLFLVDPKHYASYLAGEENESPRAYLGYIYIYCIFNYRLKALTPVNPLLCAFVFTCIILFYLFFIIFVGIIFMTLMEDLCIAQSCIVHTHRTADSLIASLASWLTNVSTPSTGPDCL